MNDIPNNATRVRILDAAEQLFAARGFAAVKLRDIASVVGMRHASLYYYAPNGKGQLYVEVMERSFRRHRQGLEAAITGAGTDLRAQLHAVAGWLVAQPPFDIIRMSQADLPTLEPAQADQLMLLAYESLRTPIVVAIERAVQAGLIGVPDSSLAAMALISLIESTHAIPAAYRTISSQEVGLQLVDMILDGWRTR
ncbi:MAG: TetR/AcrR family transcriptional regulator [Roseiflexaceae bacterium]|nr:TetR/AcrR family transcriptional regulator [Roseiflexaceae bacterium]